VSESARIVTVAAWISKVFCAVFTFVSQTLSEAIPLEGILTDYPSWNTKSF
jgi:hypothetical protein